MSNTYMGIGSTAGINVTGKVNEDIEILMNVYATSYDAADSILLTGQDGEYDPVTVREVQGRFLAIKNVVSKHNPGLMPTINKLENLAIKKAKGNISSTYFYNETKRIIRQSGVSNRLTTIIENKIDQAQYVKNGQNNNPLASLGLDHNNPLLNGDIFTISKQKPAKRSKQPKGNPLMNGSILQTFFNQQGPKKKAKSRKSKSNALMDGSALQAFFNQQPPKHKPGSNQKPKGNPLLDGSIFQQFNQPRPNQKKKHRSKKRKPQTVMELLQMGGF